MARRSGRGSPARNLARRAWPTFSAHEDAEVVFEVYELADWLGEVLGDDARGKMSARRCPRRRPARNEHEIRFAPIGGVRY